MAGAGGRRVSQLNGGPIVTATGCGPIAAGTGTAMNHGPGLVTTTARGCMIRFISGFGCRALNGRLRGSRGGGGGGVLGGGPRPRARFFGGLTPPPFFFL